MRRPQTKRALRELDAEARHNAVVLEDDDLGDSGAWRDMDNLKLPLKDQPIKGAPEVAAAPSNQSLDVYNKGWSAELDPQGKVFDGAVQRISALPLTRQGVEIAKELDTDAVQFIAAVDNSQGRKLADAAHQLHKFHTGILARLKAGPDAVRAAARSFLVRYDQEQRRKLAEEQRIREEAIRKQQEEERAALVAALEAQGATAEAEALKEAPPAPVVAPAPREATKIDGVSVVYSAGWGGITDITAFAKWLGEHPEHVAGMEPKMSYWKSMLSAHLNKTTGQLSIEIPGLKIAISGGTRHRTGNGD